MNAAERIQAAIDKLERLKAASTPGPWASADEHGDVPWATPAWCINKTSDDGRWLGDVAYLSQMGGSERADAELIVALHRTIDAQLVILRDERHRLAQSCPHCTKPWAPALILADAILGPDLPLSPGVCRSLTHRQAPDQPHSKREGSNEQSRK